MGDFKFLYVFYIVVFATFVLLALIYGNDENSLVWIKSSIFTCLYTFCFLALLSRFFKKVSSTRLATTIFIFMAGYLFSGLLFLGYARVGSALPVDSKQQTANRAKRFLLCVEYFRFACP